MSRRIAMLLPALRPGGISAFVLRLGGPLRAAGWTVEILTLEEGGSWSPLAESRGFAVSHLGASPLRSRIHQARGLGEALRREGYDALVLNHAELAQLALGSLAEETLAIPVVHGDTEIVYRTALAFPDAWNVLVAPGPRLAEEARRRRPGRPVVEIPHGVEAPDPGRLRIEERAEKALRAAYVGRIVQEHKRVLLLPGILDASLRAGLDLRLTIVGDGPERRALDASFRRLSLEDRIDWLGALRPEETYSALLDAHALLLPSSSEGVSFTLLEAQACGCVPVASRLPGATDRVVTDGLTGILLHPGAGAEAYAASLATLDRDRSRWRAMARAGHDWIASSFRVESMGEAWQRLLQEGWGGAYPLPRPRRSAPPLDPSVTTWRDRLPEGPRRGARRLRSALVASRRGRT